MWLVSGILIRPNTFCTENGIHSLLWQSHSRDGVVADDPFIFPSGEPRPTLLPISQFSRNARQFYQKSIFLIFIMSKMVQISFRRAHDEVYTNIFFGKENFIFKIAPKLWNDILIFHNSIQMAVVTSARYSSNKNQRNLNAKSKLKPISILV